MKLHLSTVILLLLTQSLTFAQDKATFKEGYIITLEGDTLYGEIRYRGDLYLAKNCVFKEKGTSNSINYIPSSIKSYRFTEGRYFVSKKVNKIYLFLEMLVDGELDLYYYRGDTKDHYLMEKEGIPLSELPYDKDEIVSLEGKTVANPQNRYLATLRYYMSDAPKIQANIKDSGENIGHKSLIELTTNYHDEVCKNNSCIVYHRKGFAVKANWEVLGSIELFSNSIAPQLGILTHLWLPRTNEKIYLKTGLIKRFTSSSNKDENNVASDISWTIPFQFEYIAPSKKIAPKLAYGWSMLIFDTQEIGFYPIPSASAGLHIPILEKASLSLNYDILFSPLKDIPLAIIPSTPIAHYLNVGVFLTI